MHDVDNIVSNGRDLNIEANIKEIEEKIRNNYHDKISKAGLLRKIYYSLKIEFDVRKEIQKRAPEDGLYLLQCRRKI